MTNNMEKEWKTGQMEQNMMDNTMKAKFMEREFYFCKWFQL